jgi:hypothetical protein
MPSATVSKVIGERGLRRTGLVAAVASGSAMVALGFTGLAGVDQRLEAAAQRDASEPREARTFDAHDCPERDAAERRERS